MRILLLANNWLGWKIARWARKEGDHIVGLVLHPPDRRKYGQEIIEAAGVNPCHVFDGSKLRQRDVLRAVKGLDAEIGLSVLFGYILQEEFLELFPGGCVNLHPSFLPYNRGAYPNVWSIIDETPAGVSLHYIDKGIDTGALIAQSPVSIEPVDTGESLYRKLEKAAVDLFEETWPKVRAGKAPKISYKRVEGRLHRVRDVKEIDEIETDRQYTARELINIIRARTFPPYPGAYFRHHGRKIYLRLHLSYEQMDEPDHDQRTRED